jgi:polysaccharide biosynthesis transport protein
MKIDQIIAVLRARLLLVAGIILSTSAIAAAISFSLPKQYAATSAVILDVKSPDPINGIVLQGMLTPGYMGTQMDVIRSERNVRKVIDKLKMADVPLLREQWVVDTDSKSDFMSWLAQIIQKNLQVQPSKESNVIEVTYVAADPNFAAAMTNAIVSSYQETTVELRAEPAKRNTLMFEAQAVLLKDKLSAAQTKLSNFLQEHSIVATDERIDTETARLAELSSQLVAIQSMKADSASRGDTASSTNTEVINNSLIASIKSDLSRQEANLKELSNRYGPAHPLVADAQASISELRNKLSQEISNVNASITTTTSTLSKREARTVAALDEQRNKVLRLKELRSQAHILNQDIESAQRALETVQMRIAQASLESQSTQTNINILKIATAPNVHASPKILLNILVAVFLGTVIAVGTALLMEKANEVIRTDEHISETLGVPLLGEIGSTGKAAKPNSRRAKVIAASVVDIPLLENRQ